jgi:hypothetical protein
MDIDITLTLFILNMMFSSLFQINSCFYPFLLSLLPAEDSSCSRSEGTKRIMGRVQKLMIFNILDKILKLLFETIFKWD